MHPGPVEVARAFLAALTDETPMRRSMVVPNWDEAETTVRAVLGRLVQLNRDLPYSFNREELIGMLDQALAGA